MPVTKKKGAIFAVYADTPPRASLSASGSSTSSRRSASPTKSAQPSATAAQPRRALAPLPPTGARALQPKAPKALGAVGGVAGVAGVSEKDFLGKPKILASKPLGAKSLGAKPLSTKSQAKPLAGKPLARKPLGTTSEMKPLRASAGSLAPPRAPLRAGAGRTFDIFIDAPALAAKPRAGAGAGRAFEIFIDDAAPVAPIAKPARPLASSAEDKENGPPRAALASKTVAPLGGVTKKAAGKPLRARLLAPLVPVPVLADASDAYGASGDEPAGFRDVGRGGREVCVSCLA